MDLDPTTLAIVIAVVLIVLTSIFLLLKKGVKKDTVLLVGLSDSGKTHIFSKIANKNAEPITYTSLQENAIELEIKGSPMKVVDFPGNERLRKQLVDKWLKKDRATLKKIVFVVDSASFTKRTRDVAEFLYDIALESGKKIPIIAACNKQDLTLAKSEQVIRNALEKEIGLINKTRSAALTTTDGTANRDTLTGTGDSFKWDDLPKPVEFVVCSAVDSAGLDDLRAMIRE